MGIPDEVTLRSLLKLFHRPISSTEADSFKKLVGSGAEVWPFIGRFRVHAKRELNASFLAPKCKVRQNIVSILWGPNEPEQLGRTYFMWRRDDFIRDVADIREPWRRELNWHY